MEYMNVLKTIDNKSLIDDKNYFQYKKSFDDYIVDDVEEGFYIQKTSFYQIFQLKMVIYYI
jgi:hypothetical protein